MDVKLFFPIDDPKRIVLRNPIARAIAAQKLTQQIRKFCIGLYQLREGEEVVREAEHAATVDRSLQICAARYPKIPTDVLYAAYATMEQGDAKALIAAIKARMVPA